MQYPLTAGLSATIIMAGDFYIVNLRVAIVCDTPRTEFGQKGKPPGRRQVCPAGWAPLTLIVVRG